MTLRPSLTATSLAAALVAFAAPGLTAIAPAFAQTAQAALPGIGTGMAAPAITGTTQSGAAADFASLTGEKGLVIAFVRSADWCPFCKEQLKDLNTISAGLEAKGFKLVALSYDPVEKLEKFSKSAKLTYTLVSDEDSSVIDAFGLRNMEVANNKRMNGIPHPAIYVITADNMIHAKLSEEGYKKRPPTELVMKAVDDVLAHMAAKG